MNYTIITDLRDQKERIREMLHCAAEIKGEKVGKLGSKFKGFYEGFYIDEYTLCGFYRDNYLGLRLDSQYGKILLEFMQGSKRSGALLQDSNGEIWLAHTGRVHWKHAEARPKNDNKVTVGKREYYLVSKSDDDIAARIIDFHLSREGEDASPIQAISRGPFKNGERKSCVFEAVHSPIVENLRHYLESNGWTISKKIRDFDADLVCEKQGTKVLFEIKPASEVHSIVCAAGQCLVYNTAHQAHRKIIIALKKNGKSCPPRIQSAIQQLGVELVYAEEAGKSNFRFAFKKGDNLNVEH